MAISDLIAEERKLYLSSAQTRHDWFRYVTAVERLRRLQREECSSGERPHQGP